MMEEIENSDDLPQVTLHTSLRFRVYGWVVEEIENSDDLPQETHHTIHRYKHRSIYGGRFGPV